MWTFFFFVSIFSSWLGILIIWGCYNKDHNNHYTIIQTRASERMHSWATLFTPRWPQFPVLQRLKHPNYNCTSLVQHIGSHISSLLFAPMHMQNWPKVKLGQVEVGLNIAQNHSSSPYKVISGHYLPKCIWKVDQKWN